MEKSEDTDAEMLSKSNLMNRNNRSDIRGTNTVQPTEQMQQVQELK